MAKRKPASEMVIDQPAPAEPARASIDAPEQTKVDQLTDQAQKAIVPWATGGKLSIEFHPTMLEIAAIKAQAQQLLTDNVDAGGIIKTKEGYDAIWARYRELVPLRTSVDERRLEEGRQAREYVKMVNTLGNAVINAIADIEKPLKAAVDATDRQKEEAALAKALAIEAEQKRLEDERLAKIAAEEAAKKAAEEARLQAERDQIAADRKRVEEERRAFVQEQDRQRAEQQQKIDEERAKMEAERAAMRKEQDALRAEQDRQRVENERLQREAREKIERERAAEAHRLAEEKRLKELEEAKARAAKEAIEAAERKRVADEKAAKEKAEREAKEAAERAAKAPDRAKVKVLANHLRENLPIPLVVTKQGKQVMERFDAGLVELLRGLNAFIGEK